MPEGACGWTGTGLSCGRSKVPLVYIVSDCTKTGRVHAVFSRMGKIDEKEA
jgi:hypothetical protein